ncbi:MAG: hypothetical protein ACXWQR_24245 [Ktedonobacterales bacterium]
MRSTTRTYDNPTAAPGGNFIETTAGEIVGTLEMSQNAKGRWQPSIKLHFTSIDGMVADGARIAADIKDNLKQRGFQLADE